VPSALDVEAKLLGVLDLEAQRLLEKVEGGQELDKADRINLSYFLRAATDAAAAEVDRMEKLDPEHLNDKLLDRLLKSEKEASGKPRRA
jgi:hypothetical protein